MENTFVNDNANSDKEAQIDNDNVALLDSMSDGDTILCQDLY